MESDADRLAMLQALGGRLIFLGDSKVCAVFENGFFETTPGVESRQPYLLCRTSDLPPAFQKETDVDVGAEHFRVKRLEDDGTGLTRIVLKR